MYACITYVNYLYYKKIQKFVDETFKSYQRSSKFSIMMSLQQTSWRYY